MLKKKAVNQLKKMAAFEQQWAAKFAVDDGTGQFLHDLILEKKPKLLLEMGTWRGASAIYLASALQELGEGTLITVDFDNDRSHEAVENITAAGVAEFVTNSMVGIDAYLQNDHRKYDFIFMDAAKKQQGRWLTELMRAHVQAGTIIVVDDVITMGDRMQDLFLYVDELVQQNRVTSTLEKIDDGLLILEVLN